MRRRLVFGLAAALFLLAGLDRSALSDAPAGADEAVFVGSLRLTSAEAAFGGLSGLHVDRDGMAMIAISDRSSYVRADLVRDASGRLASARLGKMKVLRGTAVDESAGHRGDSEGLAIAPDGRIFVSYEGVSPWLARFASFGSQPVRLPANPAFVFRDKNTSLEALAVDARGTLYVVPEELNDRTIPVYRFQAGKWRAPLSVPRIGTFRPVAADIGPDGRFYLLERRFDAFGGFASRLRRFDLGRDGLSAGTTLLQTPSRRHDNLEGLSVWRARDGLRATMVSDDNFFSFQVTELVEYRLPD